MRDISLHLLDLVQNSIAADAKNITIALRMDDKGWLNLEIADDGHGMDTANKDQVMNPFYTTRKTRKIGLGLSLTAANARLTGGNVNIQSVPGQGTTFIATFNTRHIDCLPLGDIAGSISSLIIANPDTPEFTLSCCSPSGEYSFSTAEARQILDGVSLSEPEVVAWINQSIRSEMITVLGGIAQ
jgi:hypothetical protein